MGNMSEDGESSCGLSFGEDLLDPCTYSNLGESVTNSIGGPVGVSAALSTADPLLSGISLVAAYLPGTQGRYLECKAVERRYG